MTLGLLGLVVGAVVGAIGTLMLVARSAPVRRALPKETKPIIHMRGNVPAWFAKNYCQESFCVSTMRADGQSWNRCNACYVDQDGHYWCEKHLPKNTKIAERAALEETENEHCAIHDYKCPKPWAPY